MRYKDVLSLIKEGGADVKILAEEIFNVPYEKFLLYGEKEAEEDKIESLKKGIELLKEDVPVQYIIGKWTFSEREFKVGKGVLIPREDTLSAVNLAKRYLNENSIFADLGSGSAVIAVTLSKDCGCKGYAIEKSKEAFCYLESNVKALGADVKCINSDMFSPSLLESLPTLDLVVSNPPYITGSEMKALENKVLKEPHEALFGGEDGLDFYREISKKYYPKLKKGGALVFEVGYTQADAVLKILENEGYHTPQEEKDINGIRRAVCAIK